MTIDELKSRCNLGRAERDEQALLFRWALFQATKYRQLDAMFAVPNGGDRDVRVARRLKAEGVKAGVPDIFLPVPAFTSDGLFLFAGLFVELKVSNNDTSPEQNTWLTCLHEHKYAVTVQYGWENAAAAIIEYLTEPEYFVSGA